MLTTITPPGETWTNYTTTLNVTAGPHTIEFYGTVPSDQCVTALDNISLPIGSLPATTVLTVAGQSTAAGPSGTFDLGDLSQTVAGITGGTVSGGGTTYGTITNNGAAEAVLTVTGTSRFDGVLSDGASKLDLTVSGGSLTLTGNNTYTGPTTINSGTLQIGNGGTGEFLASPTVSLSNNATLAFNHSDALTYGGAIGGNGGLVEQGSSGLLVLTGGNTYTGPTTVAGGTLQIGNGTSGEALASPSIAMSNNAVVVFNHNDPLSYGGSISGSGQLIKLGTGVLDLTGTSSYSGPTRISAGTLELDVNGNNLPTTTALSIASSGVLDMDGVPQTLGSLSGSAGAIIMNHWSPLYASTLTVAPSSGSTTFAGNITSNVAFGAFRQRRIDPQRHEHLHRRDNHRRRHARHRRPQRARRQRLGDDRRRRAAGVGQRRGHRRIAYSLVAGRFGEVSLTAAAAVPTTIAPIGDKIENTTTLGDASTLPSGGGGVAVGGTAASVPEPGTMVLLAVAAVGLIGWVWRRLDRLASQ